MAFSYDQKMLAVGDNVGFVSIINTNATNYDSWAKSQSPLSSISSIVIPSKRSCIVAAGYSGQTLPTVVYKMCTFNDWEQLGLEIGAKEAIPPTINALSFSESDIGSWHFDTYIYAADNEGGLSIINLDATIDDPWLEQDTNISSLLAVSTSGNKIYIAGFDASLDDNWYSKISYSEDNGATWTSINPSTPSLKEGFNTMQVSPDGNNIYVGDDFGFVYSFNPHVTNSYVILNNGLPLSTYNSDDPVNSIIYNLFLNTNNTLYAAIGNGNIMQSLIN